MKFVSDMILLFVVMAFLVGLIAAVEHYLVMKKINKKRGEL